jgi:hypothetical protein
MTSTATSHITEAAIARSKLSSGLPGLMIDLVLLPVAIVGLRLRAQRREAYAHRPR